MAVLKDILDAQTLTPNNSFFFEIETEQQCIWSSSSLLDGGNGMVIKISVEQARETFLESMTKHSRQ